MKIYTNELGHMTNMATIPIYATNLKKSSSPEAIDDLEWKKVKIIYFLETIAALGLNVA